MIEIQRDNGLSGASGPIGHEAGEAERGAPTAEALIALARRARAPSPEGRPPSPPREALARTDPGSGAEKGREIENRAEQIVSAQGSGCGSAAA